MTFLKEGKTNWRYILIVLILAVIVGGGILWWMKEQEVPLTEFPEIKKPEKIEVTEELANKIMDKVVPENYNRKTTCFIADDLNNDNALEIFIAALKTTPLSDEYSSSNEAYLTVIRPTDEFGDYEKIADIF